jgi:ribA/ribD-fused uncharacterized protein
MEKDLQLENVLNIRIVRTHRLGTQSKGLNRPIIVRFHFGGDREAVWQKRANLKGKQVWLAEDFPQETTAIRKQMMPFLKAAWSMGKKASLKTDKLVIEGKIYTQDTLCNIPQDIDPSKACEKITKTVHLFFGRYFPFSNFYTAPFTSDGKHFTSVEQYVQYHKARVMKDDMTVDTILQEPDPFKQKALGRRIANFDAQTWATHATPIVMGGCRLKFTAHPKLQDYLKQSGKRVLGEASQDKMWGIGKTLRDSSADKQDQWAGKNELGKILMQIRADIHE